MPAPRAPIFILYSDDFSNMDRSILEGMLILTIGLLVSVGAYITLSNSAAVLFGFVYVMLIPLVHEVANYNKHI